MGEVVSRVKRADGKVVGRDLKRNQSRAYGFARVEAAGACAMATSVTRASFSPGDLMALAAAGGGLELSGVADRSPVDPAGVRSSDFLDVVFRPGEKAVICTSCRDRGRVYIAGSGAGWVNGLGSEEGIFFLSNPTDGVAKPNASEKMSIRSEGNLTDFRHMVVESDNADPGVWLRAISKLPLPAVAIYTSGGRSVHILLRFESRTKVQYLEALDLVQPGLVRLGADPAAMSAVRLTRLPGGSRGGQPQRLLFLDPAADPKPLNDRPNRKTQA
jgi:hypothetical protein